MDFQEADLNDMVIAFQKNKDLVERNETKMKHAGNDIDDVVEQLDLTKKKQQSVRERLSTLKLQMASMFFRDANSMTGGKSLTEQCNELLEKIAKLGIDEEKEEEFVEDEADTQKEKIPDFIDSIDKKEDSAAKSTLNDTVENNDDVTDDIPENVDTIVYAEEAAENIEDAVNEEEADDDDDHSRVDISCDAHN